MSPRRLGDLIRLGLELPRDAGSGTNLRFGGFHRGERGLYLNPDELPPDQWYVVLVHEFTHALDPILQEASRRSREIDLEERAREALASSRAAGRSSAVREFLRNGLDRGFLAEVRAWTVTSHLYDRMSGTAEFASVPWIFEMSGQSGLPLRDRHQNVFRFLDPRFNDPEQGLLTDVRVRSELETMRRELRQTLPPLGPLQGLFGAP